MFFTHGGLVGTFTPACTVPDLASPLIRETEVDIVDVKAELELGSSEL
jgi:hypothetical protein